MLFPFRRWALRVTERMGLSAKEPATTELVSMIVQGAKQYRTMISSVDVKLSKPELVLMAVASMTNNRSAYERLTKAGLQATELLASARVAGRALAVENDFSELVVRVFDRLPEINESEILSRPDPTHVVELANSKLKR